MTAPIEQPLAALLRIPESPETLTVSHAAHRLGVSRAHLYQTIRAGESPFPVIKLGQRVLIPRASFERYLTGEQA